MIAVQLALIRSPGHIINDLITNIIYTYVLVNNIFYIHVL